MKQELIALQKRNIADDNSEATNGSRPVSGEGLIENKTPRDTRLIESLQQQITQLRELVIKSAQQRQKPHRNSANGQEELSAESDSDGEEAPQQTSPDVIAPEKHTDAKRAVERTVSKEPKSDTPMGRVQFQQVTALPLKVIGDRFSLQQKVPPPQQTHTAPDQQAFNGTKDHLKEQRKKLLRDAFPSKKGFQTPST